MGYGMWMCGQLFIVYGNDGDNDYDSFGNALEEWNYLEGTWMCAMNKKFKSFSFQLSVNKKIKKCFQ